MLNHRHHRRQCLNGDSGSAGDIRELQPADFPQACHELLRLAPADKITARLILTAAVIAAVKEAGAVMDTTADGAVNTGYASQRTWHGGGILPQALRIAPEAGKRMVCALDRKSTRLNYSH